MSQLSQKQYNELVARLTNLNQAAEGATLPPRLQGGVRVPPPTTARAAFAGTVGSASQYIISWERPTSISPALIDHYNVVANEVRDGVTRLQATLQVPGSPATIQLIPNPPSAILFQIQTVLTNGQTSPLELSPVVSVGTAPPLG